MKFDFSVYWEDTFILKIAEHYSAYEVQEKCGIINDILWWNVGGGRVTQLWLQTFSLAVGAVLPTPIITALFSFNVATLQV